MHKEVFRTFEVKREEDVTFLTEVSPEAEGEAIFDSFVVHKTTAGLCKEVANRLFERGLRVTHIMPPLGDDAGGILMIILAEPIAGAVKTTGLLPLAVEAYLDFMPDGIECADQRGDC